MDRITARAEFYKIVNKMARIMEAKRDDYSGKTEAFSNFRECETMGVPAWVGALIRCSDKMSRCKQLAHIREWVLYALAQQDPDMPQEVLDYLRPHGASVQDEASEDTLIDLANYAIITLILREEWLQKQRAEECSETVPSVDDNKGACCR